MTELFLCECFTEGLTIEYDIKEGQIDLSLWDRGLAPRVYGWQYKLRCIWRILTKGYPYTDAMCLNADSAMKIGKKLQEVSEKILEEEKKRA